MKLTERPTEEDSTTSAICCKGFPFADGAAFAKQIAEIAPAHDEIKALTAHCGDELLELIARVKGKPKDTGAQERRSLALRIRLRAVRIGTRLCW